MEFQKYMHIEKLGREEVDGILVGDCDIFPKLDGCNASVWWDEQLCMGSRKREVTEEADNQNFWKYMMDIEQLQKFTKFFQGDSSNVTIYGEWLVPHTLKTYREEMWRRFWVFDVAVDGYYMSYDDYQPLLEHQDIDYVPRICQITNPTEDKLVQIMQSNTFGIKDGEGHGEGIVIKNYKFTNRYDRITWAKVVSTDFTDKHRKEMGEPHVKMSPVESQIAARLTQDMVDKIYANLVAENDGFWQNKMIPKLLSTVWHDFVTEELWPAIKKFKNPTVSFRMLQHHVTARLKELKPEAF